VDWQHGGFGSVRVKEPMVLGHEISGRVEAVGETRRAHSPRPTNHFRT
jgi:L-idonate 5-dehydrogenase